MTKQAQSANDEKGHHGPLVIYLSSFPLVSDFEIRISDFPIWDHIAFNIATRLSCRPPSKPVSSQIRTILSARSSGTRRWPIESTLASLCWRERRDRKSTR